MPCVVAGAGVLSTSPQTNATNVSPSANVIAYFDTVMNGATLGSSTFKLFGFQSGPVAGTYTMTNNDSTCRFDPTPPFHAGERLEAVLTTGVASALGTPLGSPYVWRFTAAAANVGDTLLTTTGWQSAPANLSESVAWGDYDGDGDLDLAVGNTYTNVLYRNDNGSLTLNPVWTSAYGGSTRDVVWGDYDGDGDLDLAAGLASGPNRLYRNDAGTLTTSPVWTSSESNNTYDAEWVDYDGDGDLDLSFGNYGAPNTIYRNDGGTLTTSPVWSTVAANNTQGIAWADYDGDGDLDMACGNRAQHNTLYRNDAGTLTTSPVWSSATTAFTFDVAWGDYDGDGDPDLACGVYNNSNIIYRNDGGTLTSSAAWASMEAYDTYCIAWGDFDGDGDEDLACGNYTGEPVNVYRNDSGLSTSTSWNSDDTPYTIGIAWGDVDGDGDLDLACANSGSANTVYYNTSPPEVLSTDPPVAGTNVPVDADVEATFNTPINLATVTDTSFVVHGTHGGGNFTGTFSLADGGQTVVFDPDSLFHAGDVVDVTITGALKGSNGLSLSTPFAWSFTVAATDVGDTLVSTYAWSSASNYPSRGIALGDFNNDGDVDMLCANWGATARNTYYTNSNGMLLENPGFISYQGLDSYDLAGADADGDGDLDVACANYPSRANTIHMNAGSGNISASPSWSSTPTNSSTSVAWGDVDGDGDPDLAFGNLAAGNTVYINNGGTFSTTPAWTSGPALETWDVEWGDYDGDGDLDLLCANAGSGEVCNLYRNDGGTLTTTPAWSAPVAYTTRSVAWGDYDGDGDLDIAMGNYGERNWIYRNDAGSFAVAVYSCVPTNHTTSIWFVDYDGDGDLDLACGNEQEPPAVYENYNGTALTADPAWQAREDFSRSTQATAWGDIDGDGDLELFTAGTSWNWVYLSGFAVCSAYPAMHDAAVEPTDNIDARFIGPVDPSTVADTTFVVHSPRLGYVAGSRGTHTAGTRASFDPVVDLAAGELYEAVLTADVKASADGEPLVHPYVWRITGAVTHNDSLVMNPFWSKWGGAVHSVAWGDYDGDGDLDLAVSGNPLCIYRNDDGAFSQTPAWSSGTIMADTRDLAWGDYDGDGDPDLACANVSMFWGQNTIFRNDGGTLTTDPAWTSNDSKASYSVEWGDYDGDGDVDLLCGGYDGEYYAGLKLIYRNDGGLITADPAVYLSSGQYTVRELAWGDYDNDGDLDVASAEDSYNNSIHRNESGIFRPGGLDKAWNPTLAQSTTCAAWGDYDGDGDLDLAFGNYSQANRIFRNDDGTFSQTPIWVSTNTANTVSIAFVDYDGDGDLDLACGNEGQQETIYRNDAGTFTVTPVRYSQHSYTTRDMDWADYDGDGDMDYAIATDEGAFIYRNRSVYPPSAVADLAVATTSDTSVTLTWTATGADYDVGTADRYDVRFSNYTIDGGNFSL
ncbi:MAG: FG-GAP-like repeat-containing protein, partial [Candidatus Latescibacterota bacterium]